MTAYRTLFGFIFLVFSVGAAVFSPIVLRIQESAIFTSLSHTLQG